MKEKGVYLNLGAWQIRSVASGPGERFVLWLQGCPLRCPGCVNTEFLPLVKRMLVSVDDIAGKILATRQIEGVTYTGGEPTVQARGLALLSERLKPTGLTVVCYTGYTLADLRRRRDQWIMRLMASVDILIDGPYVREKATNLLWRGSSNQRVHFLTQAYRHLLHRVNTAGATVEMAIGPDAFTTTGIWPPGLIERLEKALRE